MCEKCKLEQKDIAGNGDRYRYYLHVGDADVLIGACEQHFLELQRLVRVTTAMELKFDEAELKEIGRASFDLNEQLEKLKEARLMKLGCEACGGEIEEGIYRKTVYLAGMQFSEGSYEEAHIICGDCQQKIFDMLRVHE